MMQECDLPYRLIIDGTTYIMQACGFWGGNHYWCKVIRTVGGLTGAWHHNDMENAGIAKLVSRDVENIGGPLPNTSWVIYSQAPTVAESLIIKEADSKIDRSVGNKELLDRPFSQSQIEGDEHEVDEEVQNMNIEEEDYELPNDSDLEIVHNNINEVEDMFTLDDEAPVPKLKPKQSRKKTPNIQFKTSKEMEGMFASDKVASEATLEPLQNKDLQVMFASEDDYAIEAPLETVKAKQKKQGRKKSILKQEKENVEPLANKSKRGRRKSIVKEEVLPSGNVDTEEKVSSKKVSSNKQKCACDGDELAGDGAKAKKNPQWKGWVEVEENVAEEDDALEVAADSSQDRKAGIRVSKRTRRKRE
ncbi:uncharacterized protein MELLADRAFT_93759 [Melampsora larici-populina 98AG31]|uniref:Uncharacterized protein n=1 Tax=Melampsora larici-populina (strain 98AG31 / pathotype 3-4-7) TaxID=747676 RepID=F4S554_MELLP|nr:uncharacterized protein MELLADRAFT_93759 [Melampsora larici-populina 98AG31]EGG00262.1 hypothetical protein MELLADRAFT_93759 [Melampsora larici-populina 98AG31]